jgi:hypothetical protein
MEAWSRSPSNHGTRMTLRPLPLACLLLVLPAVVAAQTAQEILGAAVERYEQRVADIDNYSVIQETNGTGQVTYYEKRTVDGHPVFVPQTAADVAVSRAGLSWGQLQGMLLNAFSGAGMQALAGELQSANHDQLAVLVGSFGQRLGGGGGDVASAAKGALVSAGTDVLKDALVDAAIDAGLQALATGIGGAAGAQVGIIVQALRDSDGFGDALGNLAAALPRMVGSAVPGGGQGPGGMPGGMNTMPGGIPGGPMGAPVPSDPKSLALSAAASAGVGMLVGMGARAVGGMFSDEDPADSDPYAMLRRLSDRFRVVGSGDIEGRPAWILEATDPDGIDVGDDEFAPRSIRFHMDRADYVIRRVEMEGDMDMEGERRPVTVVVQLDDYRDVQGLLHPFHTTIAFEGMNTGMSDEEAAEMSEQMEQARRQMAEMKEQLAQLPPEQRQMIEQQMERMGGMPGMQQMEARMDALAAGRMETVVQEVRVNEGPPEELTRPRPPGV